MIAFFSDTAAVSGCWHTATTTAGSTGTNACDDNYFVVVADSEEAPLVVLPNPRPLRSEPQDTRPRPRLHRRNAHVETWPVPGRTFMA